MNHQTRLQELSVFLKTQRAKILPQSVGLAPGARRRTPGLRREEVAQLAGVSLTWYTWLEQGRAIQASKSVLDAIATALQLTIDERKYLHALATDAGSGSGMGSRQEEEPQISPALQRILQELRYCPTIITDRRCQIVGWNQAAACVFLDFQLVPIEQRNLIRLVFSRKELRRLAVNWEHFVKGFLSIFRAYYGQYLDDEWYEQFLGEMKEGYTEFDRLWEQSRVSTAPEVLIEFRHSRGGKMLFELTSLQVQGTGDLRCSVYTPAADTATETKLRQLMERNGE